MPVLLVDFDNNLTLDFLSLASGKAAEFGPLKDGFMFECSTGLSRM